MIIGRYLGVGLIVVGLLLGVALLHGSYTGHFPLGLLRTWGAISVSLLVGLALTSFCSGLAGSERAVRRAGGAIFGLGVVSGAVLALNAAGVLRLADTMQPWALLAACLIVGGIVLFGSSS